MTTTEQPVADPDLWGSGNAEDDRTAAYDQGFTDGRAAGLAARPPATCLVPAPLSWRHVRPGDVFRSPRGDLWHVNDVQARGTGLVALACKGAAVHEVPVDPDARVHVLHEVGEVDAMTLLADQLGARLIDRRTGGGPTG